MQDSEQRDAWDSFYSANRRPWRGVTGIFETPFAEGSRILEIGCGNGKTSAALKNLGYVITAMDFSEKAVEMCSELDPDIEFICADVTSMPFADSSFDGAVSFHVLEHLTDEQMKSAVAEIRRVLRPSSHLLVKVFAVGDMRSEKGESVSENTVIRGNGIRYRYFTENELCQYFSGFECSSIRTVEEKTRFGEIRRRIEADFIRM